MLGISELLKRKQNEDDQPTTNIAAISQFERLASIGLGGLLIYFGLTHRSLRGLFLGLGGGYLLQHGATGHFSLYKTMKTNMDKMEEGDGIKIEKTVTINQPIEQIYQFWRNFENLPCFMKHLESVTKIDDRQSHWVAKAPAGLTLEWDAEIVDERKNEFISWRSLPGARVENMGAVHFKKSPSKGGVEVKVIIEYLPPGGMPGVAFAKLFNDVTAQVIKEDLRRFKQLIETGEIATTQGQPSGPAIPRSIAAVKKRVSATEHNKTSETRSALQLHPRRPSHTIKTEDIVDESSWESFPASDPPSTW